METFLARPELKKSLLPDTAAISNWAKRNKIDCQLYYDGNHLDLIWKNGNGPMLEVEIWFASKKDLLRFQLEWL